MAVKKDFNKGTFTWDDVFDTQEALDAGILGSVTAGTQTTTTEGGGGFLGFGKSRGYSETTDYQANAKDFGSMIGNGQGGNASGAITAFKGRKEEQKKAKGQGMGQSQSILGGTVV